MFETIINATIQAADERQVEQIVEDRQWLNYTDEWRERHGKIVPIVPTLFLAEGNISDVELIGVIPYVSHPGASLHGTIRTYAVAIRLRIDAASKRAAEHFMSSKIWLIPNRGITFQGYSEPVPSEHSDMSISSYH